MDWQGWAITLGCPYSDGTGERGPGKYDGKFEAAPDIDHGNTKVQQSIQLPGGMSLYIGADADVFSIYMYLLYILYLLYVLYIYLPKGEPIRISFKWSTYQADQYHKSFMCFTIYDETAEHT